MITLTRQQMEAVNVLENNKLVLFTGPPGSGKTTTLASYLRSRERGTYCYAPTGRAAQRMMEAFKEQGLALEARTIHGGLVPKRCGYDGNGWTFEYNKDRPLSADRIVVDEGSMLDNATLLWLMEAIRTGSQLIIAGDPQQLPPVGKGKPFIDMIECGKIPHAQLTEVHRFAGRGAVLLQNIQSGKPLKFSGEIDLDVNAGPYGPENIVHLERATAHSAVRTLWPALQRFQARGYDLRRDVQVICCRNTAGSMSRQALNEHLSKLVNPNGKGNDKTKFRKFDKVMCLKNGLREVYDMVGEIPEKGLGKIYVANGESGIVRHVDEKQIIVQFGSKALARFTLAEAAAQMDRSYAITCHKAQGGGWPCVIYMIDKSKMVDRSLIYTSLSRFQEICVTIGQRSTLNYQLKEQHVDHRNTLLKHDLIQGLL